jgi:hypothetical protein
MDRLRVSLVLTKVGGESKKLLADQHVQCEHRGVAEKFIPLDFIMRLLWNSKIFAGLRDIDLITVHGSVVGVVTVMGDPPREVRGP